VAFLDFLKTKPASTEDSPELKVTAILATLDALREKRATEERVIAEHAAKRKDLLLKLDVPDSAILKHDTERDAAEIKLERLEVFERQLEADLRLAQGEVAEQEWRLAHDARHLAGLAYATALETSIAAKIRYEAAHAELWRVGHRIGVRVPDYGEQPQWSIPNSTSAFFVTSRERRMRKCNAAIRAPKRGGFL